jgi:hypothetical protein
MARNEEVGMTLMVTKGKVGNYDAWKEIFDTDPPKAREKATGYRILRGIEDPDEVVILVEFSSTEAAEEGRDRLVASGVLERLPEVHGPTLVAEAAHVHLG